MSSSESPDWRGSTVDVKCTCRSYLLVLNAKFVVEQFEVFSELLLPVPSTQRDLKHLTASRKCCQSGKTLPTTPTNSHEEGVALIHPDDPVDPRQVLKGIIEEDQVHLLVVLIVLLKDLTEYTKRMK